MPRVILDEHRILYYRLIPGNTGMPYLVYLHEGLGCTAMWSDFPKLLCGATGCPGLVYDRAGYGKSSPLPKTRTIHYLHDYGLRELPALLKSVIPDTPFILIGHSDGGSISLIFGAEHPHFLRAIITEAAHVFVDSETINGIKAAVKAWNKGKLTALTKYHGDKTEAVFRAWSATWLAHWFRHWNIEYLLPSIDVPLLAIQGSDDQYASTEQVKSIAARSSGSSHLKIVDNCAHIPHLEAQTVVLKLISDFIVQIREP